MTMSIQPPRIGSGDHVTTMSTDTMSTVVEIKKKRAYKRKDCGGTTNTTTVTEIKKKRPYRRKKHLHHDLIVQEILTKLPVRALQKSVLVSKLWYNSIHNDNKSLACSHFLQSQKRPQVIFSLSNVRSKFVYKTGEPIYECHFFKYTNGIYSHDNAVIFEKFRGGPNYHLFLGELVGYCNGLPCMARVGHYWTGYTIKDPNRNDVLYIVHPVKIGISTPNAQSICHGFGFDPSTNEYKLVSVFRTAQKVLNAVVFTLGTKSWRNITATSMPISGPITKIRAPAGSDKSAVFCTSCSSSSSNSGCLAWKIITTLGEAGSNSIQHQQDNSNAVNNEMDMLLLFNLHDEKFQFIQLPAKSTTDEQKKNLLVDYPHLLEFKGSPCIARIEKISVSGSDYPHHCCVDHQGSSSCCCCCKVHLYVLKDIVKQVWVKEEIFDVGVNSTVPTWLRKAAPESCFFCVGSTTMPPARIYSFSDQMFLYWFNGKFLRIYNLRSGKLQLVLPRKCEDDSISIFEAKMKEPRHIFISGHDDAYSSNMDYQLHCHEENFLSLQTFVPEGVAGEEADDFSDSYFLKRVGPPCSAFVLLNRGSKVLYTF